MSKEIKWFGIKCKVEKASYRDGTFALCLVASESQGEIFEGELICKVTTNVPGYALPDGYCLIKDYGENQGVLPLLEDLGVVRDTGERVPCGYTYANLCEVLV